MVMVSRRWKGKQIHLQGFFSSFDDVLYVSRVERWMEHAVLTDAVSSDVSSVVGTPILGMATAYNPVLTILTLC
jgi:hypothetical protein